jgi:AcrR family transcriptional regulator
MIRRMGTTGPDAEGLRERKKRRTREEISGVATRLFFEHGFEQVTLAQIAAAAEVSVKTIFNHFGSKEDLYFDRAGELQAALVETIVDRPAGTTVLGALRALLRDNRVPLRGEGWSGLEDDAAYAGFRAFLATQDRSPALRARRLTLGEELAAQLAPVLGAELRSDPDGPAVQALVAMLLAVMHLRDRVLRGAVAAGAPPAELRRRVTAVVDEAFDRLCAAFGDLDRPH